MNPSDHNQSAAIASLLCPLLRQNSVNVPIQCLVGLNDSLLDDACRGLNALGLRKRFFENKRSFVLRSILLSKECFQVFSPMVELYCKAPVEGVWWGSGAFKEQTPTDPALFDEIIRSARLAPIGPSAVVRIDITRVWDQVSPFLEKPGSASSETEALRHLEQLPDYKGPPGDPRVILDSDRVIDSIRGERCGNIPLMCYKMAYVVIPEAIYKDVDVFIAQSFGAGVGLYLFGETCKASGYLVPAVTAKSFPVEHLCFSNTHTSIAFGYPTPASIEKHNGLPILAPYFSGMVLDHADGGISYFVLGQSLDGGTTLRAVKSDGSQESLGEGGPPILKAFIGTLLRETFGEDGED
jgi:hypothetical protein